MGRNFRSIYEVITYERLFQCFHDSHLYFGEISPTEWAAFLDEEVTPRFPDGLSVIDIYGQYRNRQGAIRRERSKLLIIVVFDAPAYASRVQAILDSYRRRSKQESVLRVEQPVCTGL